MKVSILTACHNDAKFIKDCARSIVSQSYKNIEWIVVDDCSLDGSRDIIERMEYSNTRKFFNEQRMYCSSTYAKALREATGDICAVVDADDAIEPSAVERLVALYLKYPSLGYIYTQHWWCDIKLHKKKEGLSSLPPRGSSFTRMSIKKKRHCFSHWRTFKTKLRERGCLFPEGLKYSVDKNLGFALERLALGGFYPKPLYRYRYYEGNMSRVFPSQQKAKWIELAKKHEQENPTTFRIIKIS